MMPRDPYIIYLYKPLGGRYIQDCQVEFRLIGKDLSLNALMQTDQAVELQSRFKSDQG